MSFTKAVALASASDPMALKHGFIATRLMARQTNWYRCKKTFSGIKFKKFIPRLTNQRITSPTVCFHLKGIVTSLWFLLDIAIAHNIV